MTRQVDVMQLLKGDAQLADLGLKTIRRGGAIDTPQVDCFAVVRWSGDLVGFKDTSADRVTVWVYDSPGYFDRIDEICSHLRSSLTGRATLPFLEYNGVSDDLYDDVWERSVRNITFTVV